MKTLRSLSYASLAVAFTHLVFGAIVRISGSGMGCGDNWPKCYDHWFPPMDRPELVIEWTHRLLASVLIVTIGALAVATLRRRREQGVAGPGGVLRPVMAAVAIVLVTAAFGAVTVKLGNPAWATAVHWTLAMTLIAVLAAAGVRAGALGGADARIQPGTTKTARGAIIAATLAFFAVVMGGLTAKIPHANVACLNFPLCGANAGVETSAVHVQLTHRVIAFLLLFHLFGIVMALRKRAEAPVVARAARIAFGLALLQILVAGAMIGMKLPAPLRSLHEAVGVSVWIGTFVFAYLARLASRRGEGEGAALSAPSPVPADAGFPRAGRVTASQSAPARADARSASAVPSLNRTMAVDVSPKRETTGDAPEPVGPPLRAFISGEVDLVDVLGPTDARLADAVAAEALAIELSERADADAEMDLVREAIAEATAELSEPGAGRAESAIMAAAIEAAESKAETLETLAAMADAAQEEEAISTLGEEPLSALGEEPLSALGEEPLSALGEERLSALGEELPVEVAADSRELTAESRQLTAESRELTAECREPSAECREPSAESTEPPVACPEETPLKQPPHTVAVIVARGADL